MEGLVKLFVVGRPSLGLFSDEGGQFISGHGMKADGGAKVRTAASLSDIWNGRPLKRVRSTPTSLPCCRTATCRCTCKVSLTSLCSG
jgi:hypothetical protein